MQELIKLEGNQVFTDSMVIAQGTNNEHESVVALIKRYMSDIEDFGKVEFTDLKSGKRGRPTRFYQLNEEQSTLLITYLDNNEIVRGFKKKLIRQFYAMRILLMEKQSIQWQQSREQSKISRRIETDSIKRLVEYAKQQGSPISFQDKASGELQSGSKVLCQQS